MAVLDCPKNVWTVVPASGDTLLEARGRGFYVDTAGLIDAAARGEGYALDSGEAMVVASGVIGTTRVMPANPVFDGKLYHNPV